MCECVSILTGVVGQSTWFNKSRNHVNKSGKKISDNLGVRLRPGLGSNNEISTSNNREVAGYSDCIGMAMVAVAMVM